MYKIAPLSHYEAFRALLVARRKKAGLTQAALGERLGWTQSIIAKIESGERRLDVVEFFTLAGAVGFDPIKALKEYRKTIES